MPGQKQDGTPTAPAPAPATEPAPSVLELLKQATADKPAVETPPAEAKPDGEVTPPADGEVAPPESRIDDLTRKARELNVKEQELKQMRSILQEAQSQEGAGGDSTIKDIQGMLKEDPVGAAVKMAELIGMTPDEFVESLVSGGSEEPAKPAADPRIDKLTQMLEQQQKMIESMSQANQQKSAEELTRDAVEDVKGFLNNEEYTKEFPFVASYLNNEEQSSSELVFGEADRLHQELGRPQLTPDENIRLHLEAATRVESFYKDQHEQALDRMSAMPTYKGRILPRQGNGVPTQLAGTPQAKPPQETLTNTMTAEPGVQSEELTLDQRRTKAASYLAEAVKEK